MTESEFLTETSSPPEEFSWPPREDDSIPNALATTWKDSVFHPTDFFRRMPREFDLGWVLGYYLVIGVVAAGIALFWAMLLGPPLMERWLPESMREDGGTNNPIIDFLLSPLLLLVALFVFTAVVHICLLVVRGAKHGFGTSLRVFCFSAGPQLFTIVPFLGPPVAGVWSLVLTVIGLREAHETTTGKAVFAVLFPMLFFFFLAGILIALVTLVGLGRAAG